MNMLRSRFKPGLLAVALTAGVLLAGSWSAAQARTGTSTGCSAQEARVAGALAGGQNPNTAQMQSLKGCLLSQPSVASKLDPNTPTTQHRRRRRPSSPTSRTSTSSAWAS
jgi:hypothetical protein